jgi:hypothetical protein
MDCQVEAKGRCWLLGMKLPFPVSLDSFSWSWKKGSEIQGDKLLAPGSLLLPSLPLFSFSLPFKSHFIWDTCKRGNLKIRITNKSIFYFSKKFQLRSEHWGVRNRGGSKKEQSKKIQEQDIYSFSRFENDSHLWCLIFSPTEFNQ